MALISGSDKDEKATGSNDPKIVRGRVDSLTLFEITDNELGILENGSPNSLYLNFAIFFISTGLSFILSLLTTNFESDRVFYVFVIVSVVCAAFGSILAIIWLRVRGEVSDVCKKIRARVV
ncbi:hypothetical protein [Cypionkella psychrotolerans]|uniref:hypothetical protein n=1 Tax=Cypionkella psychrotolerans TaxID=1678131 RepID=UPI0012E17196|nr:hypothetical protein [Cypionkella psychrotolerans]